MLLLFYPPPPPHNHALTKLAPVRLKPGNSVQVLFDLRYDIRVRQCLQIIEKM